MERYEIRVGLNSIEIRKLIIRRNWTMKELSERLDISEVHLSRLLAHKRNPSPSTRQRFLNVFRGCGYTWDKIFRCDETTTTT